MPFSNAPTNDTYSSHRIQMAWPLRLRPGNQNWYAFAPLQVQDEGMVNALPVKGDKEQELHAVTRPGINATYITSSIENGLVRGMHVWEKTPGTVYYFLVVGTKVYTNSGTGVTPSSSSWVQVNTLLTSATTPVRFAEFIDATNIKKLVMVDGVEGYVFTSNTAGTKITSGNFPSPHRPWPVFLNGRLYLAKDGTGDIYNSDLNDPAAWTAGNFISTEVYPDDVRAILKVNNYLLAVGLVGSEFFSDVGNATGTPLARVDGAILPFGCQFDNSIAVNRDTVILLANQSDGQSTFKAIEGFKHADIESDGVLAMYTRFLRNPNVGFEVNAASCRGYFFRSDGKLYYNFLCDGVRGGQYRTALFDACYTYSFETKAWTELQYGNDTADRNNRYAFPVQFSIGNTTGVNSTYVAGNVGGTNMAFFGVLDDLYGYDQVQSLSNQQIYQEFRLPPTDFGTMNRKFMSRLSVVADTQDSTLVPLWTVMWNDADYNPFAWVSTTLSGANSMANQDYYPFITQLGSFRRRAIRLIGVTGKALTAKYVEVDINKGQQ